MPDLGDWPYSLMENSKHAMRKKVWFAIALLVVAGIVTWLLVDYLPSPEKKSRAGKARVVPVEVANIERGSIELRRSFTGTLEAAA